MICAAAPKRPIATIYGEMLHGVVDCSRRFTNWRATSTGPRTKLNAISTRTRAGPDAGSEKWHSRWPLPPSNGSESVSRLAT